MPRDFAKFGYTAGCPGCVQLQRGGGTSRNHNEICRTRLEELLEETVEGQTRKQRALDKREYLRTREFERKDEEFKHQKELDMKEKESEDVENKAEKHFIGTPQASGGRDEAEELQSGPRDYGDV